jgi:hypothetical protein
VLDHIFVTSKSAYEIHIDFGLVFVYDSGQHYWEHCKMQKCKSFYLEKPALITSAADNTKLKSLITVSNIY